MLLKDQFSYQQHTLLLVYSLVYSPIFADTGHMTCTSPRSLSRPKSWRSGLKFFLNFFFLFLHKKTPKNPKERPPLFLPTTSSRSALFLARPPRALCVCSRSRLINRSTTRASLDLSTHQNQKPRFFSIQLDTFLLAFTCQANQA